MRKLVLALVGACVFGFTATAADDWFNGGIETGWPNATSMTGGEWANTNGSSYADGKVTVSADTSAPLTFEATDGKTLAKDKVTIASTLTFTAFDALPEVPAQAKAGVISCNNKFYFIAKDGEANVWKDSGIAAKDTAVVKVTFIDDDTAVYDIDGLVSTNDIVAITEVSKVCMAGDGAISSLFATAESKGPTIDPGTGSDPETTPAITNVADGVYAVEVKTSTTTVVKVDGLNESDTLVVPSQIDTVHGVTDANQIKVSALATNEAVTVETPIDITPAFTVTVTGGSATIELNKDAVVPVKIGEAVAENVPVTPEINAVAAEPFAVKEARTDVAAHTIPGLTYQLKRFVVIDPDKRSYTNVGDAVKAKGTTTTLTDTTADRPNDKAFYIIEVTK